MEFHELIAAGHYPRFAHMGYYHGLLSGASIPSSCRQWLDTALNSLCTLYDHTAGRLQNGQGEGFGPEEYRREHEHALRLLIEVFTEMQRALEAMGSTPDRAFEGEDWLRQRECVGGPLHGVVCSQDYLKRFGFGNGNYRPETESMSAHTARDIWRWRTSIEVFV